jgi:hypothetical protein
MDRRYLGRVARLVAGGLVLAVSTGTAAEYGKVGVVGRVTIRPGLVYVRLKGLPLLCNTTGDTSTSSRQTAIVEKGSTVLGKVITEDDVNRIVATAQLSYTTGRSVDLWIEDHPSGYGCTLKAIALME